MPVHSCTKLRAAAHSCEELCVAARSNTQLHAALHSFAVDVHTAAYGSAPAVHIDTHSCAQRCIQMLSQIYTDVRKLIYTALSRYRQLYNCTQI